MGGTIPWRHVLCLLVCIGYQWYLATRGYITSKGEPNSKFPPSLAFLFPLLYMLVVIIIGVLLTKCSEKVSNAVKKVVENNYVHFPTIIFVLAAIGNFGVTLHYSYWNINPINPRFIFNGTAQHELSCSSLAIPKEDLVAIQLGLPMLVLIQVFAEYDRIRSFSRYFSFIANTLNTMDIMDLVTDVGCLQNHHKLYNFFFVVEFISVILIPFSSDPRGVDENETQKITKVAREKNRIFTLKWSIGLMVFTTFFSDLCPLIIRSCVMNKDNTQSGVNFVVKESLSVLLYGYWIIMAIKELRKVSTDDQKDAADRVIAAVS